MSPRSCVNPPPFVCLSCVGANSVPVNSTKPSGYWWCFPQALAMRLTGSRLMFFIELVPSSTKPSSPSTLRSTSKLRTESISKFSSKMRTKGPIAHDALLSFASVSRSALRPSKSRRFTSFPSVAPIGCPSGRTTITASGSGLFQLDFACTPMRLPVPTDDSTAAFVKISGSGPMPTSKYCDQSPSALSTSLTFAASGEPGSTDEIAPPIVSIS